MAVLNFFKKKSVKYLAPPFFWAGLIFWASSIPGENLPVFFSFQDVLFHIFVYFVFGWLVIRALKNYNQNLPYLTYICLSTVLGLIYGLSDEFHQLFVPYRNASALDVFFDGIGTILGSFSFNNKIFFRFFNSRYQYL